LPKSNKKYQQVGFLWVGDGRIRQMLEQPSEELGVYEDLIFAGAIRHEQASEY
jgi:hypothetical protein